MKPINSKRYLLSAGACLLIIIGVIYYYFFSSFSIKSETKYIYIDNDDNIAIAVRKGDAIKEDFNKALSEIRSNGELARLEQQNFGQ